MMHHLIPPLIRMSFLVIIAMAMAAAPLSVAASDTSVSGGISVLNEGGLSVSFGEGEVAFVTFSGGPGLVTASTGDVQYAQLPLTILDDRAEGARDPYTISLKLSSPRMVETPYFIEASNISFIQVTGLPDGLAQGWLGDGGTPNSESQETVVIRSSKAPPAGSYSVIVGVRMIIPAGTVPGIYTGNVQLTLNLDSFPD